MAEKVCCLGLILNHHLYLVIQVGNCAFASDDGVVLNLTREMEEIYTAVFGRLHHEVRIYSMFSWCLTSQLAETKRRLVSDCGLRPFSRVIISVHFDRAYSSDLPFLLSLMDS